MSRICIINYWIDQRLLLVPDVPLIWFRNNKTETVKMDDTKAVKAAGSHVLSCFLQKKKVHNVLQWAFLVFDFMNI